MKQFAKSHNSPAQPHPSPFPAAWQPLAFGSACLICHRATQPSQAIPGICRICLNQLPWRFQNAEMGWPLDLFSARQPLPEAVLRILLHQKIIAVFQYDAAVRSGLLALKFSDASEWAQTFAAMAVQTLLRTGRKFDAVIAIPLHRDRLAERGYNQAGLIAAEIAHRINCPDWSDALMRTRATGRQSEQTSREARKNNLSDAFVWTGPKQLKAARILLIDDVLTTGATLAAAALPLFSAGAQVTGLVIASDHRN